MSTGPTEETAPKKSLRPLLYRAGIAAGAAFAIMAALHTPAVRAKLLGASAGCPWGKPPDPKELEENRKAVAAKMRTDRRATARPAFGFALDRTTKAEVLAWGKAESRTCTDELGGAAIRCEASDAEKGVVRDAFFRFDPQGKLVGVDLMREGTDPEAAAALVGKLESEVSNAAGKPSSTRGTVSGQHLGSGYLSQAAFEYRFADYAADISATNLGAQGIVVREQYRSLANGS
ncbi:MAG: hypothetical protein JST00_41385 [Deltaproteobacteria bacterium]|nr:hypothetical protein [Deltaproteobacteria bacterium]